MIGKQGRSSKLFSSSRINLVLLLIILFASNATCWKEKPTNTKLYKSTTNQEKLTAKKVTKEELEKVRDLFAERKKRMDKKENQPHLFPMKKKIDFDVKKDLNYNGETKKMQAYKLGTPEYEKRKAVVQKYLDKMEEGEKKGIRKKKEIITKDFYPKKVSKNLVFEKKKTVPQKLNLEQKQKNNLGLAFSSSRKEQLLKDKEQFVKDNQPGVLKDHQRVMADAVLLPIKKDLKPKSFIQQKAEKIPIVRKMYKMSEEEELILDASSALVISLTMGTFQRKDKPLATSEKRVLLDFLQLLSVSLPPEWKLHELLIDFEDNIDFISLQRPNLIEILRKHRRARAGFSASCKKKNARGDMNGFSCGFWKLLHLTTIGVAEQRGGLNLVEAGVDVRSFSPASAAETIRNYINVFYNSCNKCRNNFVAMYDHCENSRACELHDDEESATGSDWSDLAKWLWEVHNEINILQLKESITSKSNSNVAPKDQMKVMYPNLDNCIQCFNSDGTWNDDAVFLYLEKIYWYDIDLGEPRIDRLLFSRHSDEGYDHTSGILSIWIYLFSFIGLFAIIARHPSNNLFVRNIVNGTSGYKFTGKRAE